MATTILVIDDDTAVRDVIARSLSSPDRKLLMAGSGEDALTLVKEFKPDLIIVDIGLPGMNGYETSAKLRDNPALKQIPIIFLSGKSQAEDNGRAFASGAQLYLRKPFTPHEIRTLVELTLSSIPIHSR